MNWNHRLLALATTPLLAASTLLGQATDAKPVVAAPVSTSPVSINVYDRTRTVANNWFPDSPLTSTYPYVEQMIRFSVAQRTKHFDWLVEGSQNDVFDVPTTAVSSVTAQGQLGIGGTDYAADFGNTLPAAASFRQGYLRYHGKGRDTTLRVGRFEFFEGAETTPKDASILWLENNRIQQRLIGNFGFSNGQRSFDGIDGHYGKGTWDITAMAGRATQGVFNMNANPELNVDIQYVAFTQSAFKNHFVWRAFTIGYHDGRTGLTKTDNRALAVRQTDHKNIRLGTYGGDFIGTIPTKAGTFDVLFWGALQNGQWGLLDQQSGAFATEAGFRLNTIATKPWLRGGYFRSTGDTNNTDGTHNTFVQLLPTPRIYARFPFFNLMNNTDGFVSFIDSPLKNLEVRTDLHFVKLSAFQDLWYGGGGAYDNVAFGFTGRPASPSESLASTLDISSDYQLTKSLALNLFYSHAYGKTVVAQDYPQGHAANFGYLELVYKWGIKQRPMAK